MGSIFKFRGPCSWQWPKFSGLGTIRMVEAVYGGVYGAIDLHRIGAELKC